MVKTTETIIGISIGTRFVGLAVIQNGTLIDFGVKTFLEAWSPEKLSRILRVLETYIENYNITHIVIKRTHVSLASIGLTQLFKGITSLAENLNIPYQPFTVDELKYYCNGASTKYALMQYIFQKYPEVEKSTRLTNSNLNYVLKTVEAVSLADSMRY